MGAVEPRSEDGAGGCEPTSEQAKSRGLEEESSIEEGIHSGLGLEGSVAGTHSNGVNVASNGEKSSDDVDDPIRSGVALSVLKTARLVQNNVSVERGNEEDMDVDISGVNDGYGLGDSDMKGVSSLLKMRGSLWQMNNPHGGGHEKVDRLDLRFNSAKTETDFSTSGHDVQLLQAIRDGMQELSGSKRDVLKRRVVQNNADSQTENRKNPQRTVEDTSDISMAATSEGKDVEVDDASYEGCYFSVGDFVWGKIKSHPWWPGRIYDPADASDYASKFKTKSCHLVAYFGDGTFAWCHPSQLKPFDGNFAEMVKHSNSKAFVNAVQDAVREFSRVLQSKMISVLTEASENGSGRPLAQNSGIKEGVHIPECSTWKLVTTMSETAELFSQVREIAEVISITSVLELEIIKCHLSALYFSRGGYSLPVYHEPKPVLGLEDTSDDITERTVNRAVNLLIEGPCDEHGTPKFDWACQMIRKCPALSDDVKHPRRKQKSIAEIMGEGDSFDSKNKRIQPEQVMEIQGMPMTSGEKKRSHVEESHFSQDGEKSGLGADQTDGIDCSWDEQGTDQGSLPVVKKRMRKIDSEVNTGKTLLSSEGVQTNFSLLSKDPIKETLSRERKKSRYLSPPFTNINRTPRKKNAEIAALGISDDQSEQNSTGLAHFSTIPSTSIDEVPQRVSELVPICKPVDKSTFQTPEQDQSQDIDPTKIKASSVEVLSEICSAAISAQCARGLGFSAKVENFIYTFRSSVYRNGSLHKVYIKSLGKKRKNSESAVELSQRNKNQNGENQADVEPEKKKIKKANPDAQKQQLSSPPKPSANRYDGGGSPAVLFVTFGPGSSLPSKAELVNIYGKFGALNETETDIFYKKFCAQVTFMKSIDAEEALKQSQRSSPFGTSKVNFHVQHSPSASKISKCKEVSKPKSFLHGTAYGAPQMTSGLGTPISQSSQLLSIRQKLLTMNSMVQSSEDELSPTMKTRLENELKVLLEKVNAMVESSSASKT